MAPHNPEEMILEGYDTMFRLTSSTAILTALLPSYLAFAEEEVMPAFTISRIIAKTDTLSFLLLNIFARGVPGDITLDFIKQPHPKATLGNVIRNSVTIALSRHQYSHR